MLKEQIKRGNVTIDVVMDDQDLCRPIELYINGKKVHLYDLGISKDIEPDNAPPCGCGNRAFIPNEYKKNTLMKYGLTLMDAEDLAALLKQKFSIGFCRRCK